jgi:hypothetical protein
MPAVIVLCAAALALIAPLAQAKTVTTNGVSLSASGTLAYTWQASPALGCATVGVCGVQGAAIFNVQDASYLAPPHQAAQLMLNGAATARTLGPSPYASCVDSLSINQLTLNIDPRLKRQSLAPARFAGPLPSAGRCSGPLESDIARLRIPVTRSGVHFDLRSTQSETAGPFVVRLISSLMLRPGGNGGSSVSSGSGSFTGSFGNPGRRLHGHRVFFESGTARYSFAQPAGGLLASFRAAPAPFCNVLGACGTTGTVSLAVVAPKPLTLMSTFTSRRRLDRAQLINGLGRAALFGRSQAAIGVRVSETVTSGGIVICSSAQIAAADIQLFPGRRGVSVTLVSGSPFPFPGGGGSTLRTYCAGPDDSDLGVSNTSIAAGALSGSFGASELGVRLSHRNPFSGSDYSGAWSGSLTLGLKLLSLHASQTPGVLP